MNSKAPPSSKEVKCPQCGRLTFYSPENPFRPFCSDRCRTNDLGAWASESYRVASTPTDFTEEPANPDESNGDDDPS